MIFHGSAQNVLDPEIVTASYWLLVHYHGIFILKPLFPRI